MISLAGVPFFRQETEYTCGPAVLRMVLGYFGTQVDENHLIHEVHTSVKDGTHHRWLMTAPTHHGLHAHVHARASLKDVEEQLLGGHPVIVHYLEPEGNESHYAVVVGVDEDNVVLNDPWLGEGFTLSRPEFESRWHDEKNRFPSWMMAISDAPFSRD